MSHRTRRETPLGARLFPAVDLQLWLALATAILLVVSALVVGLLLVAQ
jgi:hypothetical protein